MNADLKRIRTEAETGLLEAFADIEDALPGRAETHAARRARMGLFEREGLPHRRVEQWKYTDLRTLMRSLAPLAQTAGDVDVPAPLMDGAMQIVIADGFVRPIGGAPKGVGFHSLSDALAAGSVELSGADTPDRAVDALNAALGKDLGKYSAYLADWRLVDFKVRIISPQAGTGAVTRVVIESADDSGATWHTVGVSTNIIDASFQALIDALITKLLRENAPA